MKIIDLLNKIANGETLPKKICYDDIIYILIDNGIYSWYKNEEGNEGFLDNVSNVKDFLNDEVEIIKEPKNIEKITVRERTLGFPNGEWTARNMDKAFAIKINELIDEINNLKEK